MVEAREWGLVNGVVDDLESGLQQLLGDLARRSPAVLRLAREAMGRSLEQAETIYREQPRQTLDVVEGVAAFLEKRRPQWQGR